MKGIKGSNGPGLEKGAPGGKSTRKQVGPVDQAHLPTLPSPLRGLSLGLQIWNLRKWPPTLPGKLPALF